MSFIEVEDGTRIRLHDRGDGPAVILIHGWKMSHCAWEQAYYHLSKSFRVISYDLRGMGESDKNFTTHSFSQYADDLNYMINKLDLKDVTLVGWSMGCSVTLSCLRTGNDKIERIVLMNGPVKLINTDGFKYGISQLYFDQLMKNLTTSWPECERAFVKENFWKEHPEYVDWFTRIALQTPLDIALNVVEQQSKLDFQDDIAKMELPVLSLYGRHDPYYPVGLGEWIAATAKNGRCHIFEESAHCPPIEETAEFVQVLSDFILN